MLDTDGTTSVPGRRLDIFIGYKSEDRERVRLLATALMDIGYSVFWDQEIPPGSTWRETIGQALQEASVVIMCWSKATLDSNAAKWVLDEADEAVRTRKPIVPVQLDNVSPPMGHRQIQALNLSAWTGDKRAPAFAELQFALAEAFQGGTRTGKTIARREKRGGSVALLLGSTVLALAIGFGVGQLFPLTTLMEKAPTLVARYDAQLLDDRVASVVRAERRSANFEPVTGPLIGGEVQEVIRMGADTAYACIDFDHGAMFEGTLKRTPRSLDTSSDNPSLLDASTMFDVTGFGVMWASDGSVESQGRWEAGQLVEPFPNPRNTKADMTAAIERREVAASTENTLQQQPKRKATACESRPGLRPESSRESMRENSLVHPGVGDEPSGNSPDDESILKPRTTSDGISPP